MGVTSAFKFGDHEPSTLTRVSPEEPVYGTLHACAQEIRNGATAVVERKWLRCFRDVSYAFEALGGPATLTVRSTFLRDELVELGETVARTACGVVLEIMAVTEMIRARKAATIYDKYYHGCSYSSIMMLFPSGFVSFELDFCCLF